MEFTVSTSVVDGVAFAAIAGEADISTAPDVKQALTGLVDGGATRLVVDLSDATFVDSTTLGVLMGAARRVRAQQGDLAIVCRDPNIRKIFEITLLDRILDIHESAAYAVTGFDEPSNGSSTER